MAELHKLDPDLFTALRAYEAGPAGDDGSGIAVLLRVEVDPDPDPGGEGEPDPAAVEDVLAALVDLGFEAHSVVGDEAQGVVRFARLAELTDHAAVRSVSAGRLPRPQILSAARDVRARASSSTTVGAGGDGLWHVDPATLSLTTVPGGAGAGVIVAVVDSGIDFRHPMFLRAPAAPGGPPRSRILRLWDQGLPPASVDAGPDTALLGSNATYGVEYRRPAIEAALAGGPDLAHRDCYGHGTFVAGVAAGSPVTAANGDVLVGTAPQADLVVVKFLDTPADVRFRHQAGFGDPVGPDVRARDAILYCLRVAAAENRPVVVNMSWGGNVAPGDALDEQALFADRLLRPDRPGEVHGPGKKVRFPTRAVLVKACGNDGDREDRQSAVVTVPATGRIVVPVELFDQRERTHHEWRQCQWSLFRTGTYVMLWYRRPAPPEAPGAVQVAARLPRQPGFGPRVGLRDVSWRPFLARPGVPPELDSMSDEALSLTLRHGDPGPVANPRRGATARAWRHFVWYAIDPYVEELRPGFPINATYAPGIHELMIEGPAGTQFFLMCSQRPFGGGLGVGFRVADTMADGITALPAGIELTARSTAVDVLGRHALAVAAYDDADGNPDGPKYRTVAAYSSRGPLRDFAFPPDPAPDPLTKPDIAAPGVHITAPLGSEVRDGLLRIRAGWTSDRRFRNAGGTSAAAPVVAGIVAAMLARNPGQSTAEVRARLAAVPGSNPPVGTPGHDQAFGQGLVDALASHLATPLPGTNP